MTRPNTIGRYYVMLPSFLRIKVSGLQRKNIFFIIIMRLFRRSLKNFHRFLLASVLFVSLIVFFLFSNQENSFFQRFHNWISETITIGMVYIQTPFRLLDSYCQTQASLRKQIEILTLENQRLHRLEQQAFSFQTENVILRKLAKAVAESPLEIITARVLGKPTDHLGSSLVIEKQPFINFQKNQVVLSDEGVIGRIYKVGLGCAWVLLITDSRSRIPARIVSTREEVILVGENTLELRVLHTASSTVNMPTSPQKGDLLVTSGVGGIYPPGLPIARICNSTEGSLKAVTLAKEYGDYIMILKNVVPTEHDILF